MKVTWMREPTSRIAHGFAEIDLSAGFPAIEPVGPCGRFPVTDLVEDRHAERCQACLRAIRARGT